MLSGCLSILSGCLKYATYFNLPSRLNGGGNRDRTDDPLLAKQMLYQLSYTPNSLNGGSGRT